MPKISALETLLGTPCWSAAAIHVIVPSVFRSDYPCGALVALPPALLNSGMVIRTKVNGDKDDAVSPLHGV